MKKILLFTVFSISINAFAQSDNPAFNLQHRTLNSLEDVQGMMGKNEWKTSDIYSEKNLGQTINHGTPQQRSLIQIYDSIYYWDWDLSNNGWKFGYKITDMIYDVNNNLTSELYQQWMGNVWENSGLSYYTYDDNNNQTSHLLQQWYGSVWKNFQQWLYTYDENNNQISKLEQFWGGFVGWTNTMLYTYAYDENNNLTSLLYQFYISSSGWENLWLYAYAYDDSNILTSYSRQFWNIDIWVNDWQYAYSYDANNNMTSELYQVWNSGDWVNDSLHNYTYDINNDQISKLEKFWNGNGWENYKQHTYTYDINHNQTSWLVQNWIDGAWGNVEQCTYTYTYDENNFTTGDSYKGWVSDGTVVWDGDSTHYYFKTVVGIDDLIVPLETITIYPNPSSGKLIISSNRNISSIEIYNLVGEQIYSDFKLNPQTSTEINLSGSAKGIYFIKIYNYKNMYCRKIIVN